ncbi:hypothetical protein B0H34DRAFT_727342 [Crassisporium funariophilum]|nr:hypothetical protein B0H34DRAFT_727342 [Crassisporium funariophilum]
MMTLRARMRLTLLLLAVVCALAVSQASNLSTKQVVLHCVGAAAASTPTPVVAPMLSQAYKSLAPWSSYDHPDEWEGDMPGPQEGVEASIRPQRLFPGISCV